MTFHFAFYQNKNFASVYACSSVLKGKSCCHVKLWDGGQLSTSSLCSGVSLCVYCFSFIVAICLTVSIGRLPLRVEYYTS